MSARDGLLDSCWVPRFRAHLGLSGLGFVLSLRAGCRWDEHQVIDHAAIDKTPGLDPSASVFHADAPAKTYGSLGFTV